MRYCPICSKELQDDMQFCPSCGTSVQITDEDPMPNRATYVGEPIPKKKHKGIVVIIILLILIAGAWFLYSNASSVNTYNQFVDLYNTIADGARKAETANILITDVWKNSIFQTSDEETDKYTKANGGSGQFYDDFNDALSSLYEDQDFVDDLNEIYTLQTKAETLIKDLTKHPKALRKNTQILKIVIICL